MVEKKTTVAKPAPAAKPVAAPTKVVPSVPTTPVKASGDKTPPPPVQPAPFTPAAGNPKTPTTAAPSPLGKEDEPMLDEDEEGIPADEKNKRKLINEEHREHTPPPPAQPEPFTPAQTDPNAVPRDTGGQIAPEGERREANTEASKSILERDPKEFVADPEDLPITGRDPSRFATPANPKEDRG